MVWARLKLAAADPNVPDADLGECSRGHDEIFITKPGQGRRERPL